QTWRRFDQHPPRVFAIVGARPLETEGPLLMMFRSLGWIVTCVGALGLVGCKAGIVDFPDGCGNGLLGQHEECDDGNLTAGDGCSPECVLEAGFACPEPGAACEPIGGAGGDGGAGG